METLRPCEVAERIHVEYCAALCIFLCVCQDRFRLGGSVPVSIMRRRKARCEIILFHLIVVVIFVISCGTAVDAVVTVKERGDECVRYLPKWISKDDVAILCKEGKVNYSGVVQCTRALRESDADIVKQLCTNSPSVAPAHCFHVSTRMREVSNSSTMDWKQCYLVYWSLLEGLFKFTLAAVLGIMYAPSAFKNYTHVMLETS